MSERRVPEDVKGKEVTLDLERRNIHIGWPSNPDFIKGKLARSVKVDDITWHIEPADGHKLLTIYMPKVDRFSWWDSVIEGDDKINIRKIVPNNSSINDLDRDTRKTIEKMMVGTAEIIDLNATV